MKQISLAEGSFEAYGKATRREQFLADMQRVVPWQSLVALIEPVYPKQVCAGRPPITLVKMLRIYFLQQWYDLSDPGVEEALYDSVSMRRFVGIDLGTEGAPDETTICKFRHLREAQHLRDQMFAAVNAHLAENGLRVSRGTMVDATIISAPSSTKNQDKARDGEMHQTKKGNQWHFGTGWPRAMMAHIGADTKTKLIHSVVASAANVHDSVALPELLHGDETRVYGDKAYAGQGQRIQAHAPHAKDFTQRKAYRHRALSARDERANRHKSKVQAKVEHIFFAIKRQFKFVKVRYRGLAKNAHRLFVLCGLTNLFLARRHLLRWQG
jgi:transposase, IS5 family